MPSMKVPGGSSPQRGRVDGPTKATRLLVLSDDQNPEFPLSGDIKKSLAGLPGNMPTSMSHWFSILEFENRQRRKARG